MKQTLITFCFGFLTFLVGAQNTELKGKVVDATSNEPLAAVELRIQGSQITANTNAEGLFDFPSQNLPLGEQILLVNKTDYVLQRIPITIEAGRTINIDPILLVLDLTQVEAQIGIISLSDNELNQDEGTAFNISGLLQATNDVFLNAAAFDFSATFFRPRGLDNQNGKVLINGIEMNKQFNGRPQWANWGGLNDVQRNREFVYGLKANDYQFGDLAGTTNIIMRASKYRQGGRVSYAFANRSYAGRVMATYNTGVNQNGWAFSVSASRRFGEEGYFDGTFYDANSFFASVEKQINDNHSLNFTAFYTPNDRGRGTAITQEMRDLKGIRYNPNWGFQEGDIRNSRIRSTKEPVLMLNHYWNISEKTTLNTNIGYQFGKIGNTRIDNGGTRLVVTPDGQETYIGGARNPFPNYWQRLPSAFLRGDNPTAEDFQNAFLAEQDFINDGQINWQDLYRANTISTATGGNSIYIIQNDVVEDSQITANTIFSTEVNDNISLNASLNYRGLRSQNYAEVDDLLGGTGYLDVDFFAEDDVQTIVGDLAQSDLRNRNRIVREGDRYRYNYDLEATVISGFAQAQFKYNAVDFYVAANASQTNYQRIGLYENGNFPGNRSFGESEQLDFTDYGVKGGFTYKVTGRHLVDVNAGYFTKAPYLRNSFTNARQNNDVVIGLDSEKIQNVDVSYIYRSPIVKARLTGYYNTIQDQTDIGFYFTENISGLGIEQDAFIQEITTGIDTRRIGAELGIEAQVTPTLKLKAAGSFGENVFTNNPNLYIASDDFEGNLTFGDGTTRLKDYHVAAGPERAYQIGFEYRDPDFWWVGVTTNYFSDAYIDVNALTRSENFSRDFDGLQFNDYNEEEARSLLRQEKLDDYFLVNIVGGKSWKINDYFVGFFATINNALDQEYVTGGFEQGRLSNFRDIRDDVNNTGGRVFGNRYFFGSGTTYYLNLYLRF